MEVAGFEYSFSQEVFKTRRGRARAAKFKESLVLGVPAEAPTT